MIRVLIVVDKLSHGDSTIHGVTQLFSWWLPRFNKDKYSVSVCCLRARDAGGEYIERLNTEVFYLARSKFDPRTISDLLALIKKEKIDVLHLHGYGAATFGRICGSIKNIPCIVHEHMFDAGIPFYQRIADFILQGFTAWSIADTDSVKKFLVDYRFINPNKMDIVYNGVPLETLGYSPNNQDPAPDKKALKSLNVPSPHMTVAIIGRLHPIKGHHYFLNAARIVLNKFDQVTFIVVGDGELFDSLQEEAFQLGISDRVIFTGFFKELSQLLTEIDIKVISSISEGFPLTLLEAMASQCAIVSTKVGGIGEIIIDGETGFLVSPEDPESLAQRILKLLEDPQLCKDMAQKAHEAVHKYDVSHTVRKLEECYDEVANR